MPDAPLLTRSQEVRLARHARRGCRRSRDTLVERNLRLVVSIATRHAGRGVPLEDLVQEGAIGLMRAADKFDPERGWKFSTYATYWIRQSITRAIATSSRQIRLPQHVHDRLVAAARARADLRATLGRDPSPAEISSALGDPDLPPFLEQTETVAAEPVSLSSPPTRPTDRSPEPGELAELLPDPSAPDPETEALAAWEASLLRHELGRLRDPLHNTVLRHRYGLDGEPEKTLETVGRRLKRSGEHVRALQQSAESLLRERLRDHLRGLSPPPDARSAA